MDCNECVKRLYEFLDVELDATKVAEIRQHLDDCPPCEDRLAFEKQFLAVLRRSCTSGAAPKHLRERIVLRLRDPE